MGFLQLKMVESSRKFMFYVELCPVWDVKFTQIKDSEMCRKPMGFLPDDFSYVRRKSCVRP